MSDEALWISIQRKTFTRWCNNFLVARNLTINNLEKDLNDGFLLHNLLECLSNEKVIPAPKKGVWQKVENINICLRYIKSKDINLVNISGEDIFDGKTKLILGLIWTLILRFQIAGDYGDDPNQGARQALLDWCNSVLNPQGLKVTNFKDSWSDGRAFVGLVDALSPNEIDLASCPPENAEKNLNTAFDKAEELFSFPKVLDAIDVIQNPDELSIMTYVSYFRAFLAANTAFAPKTYAEGPGLTKAVTNETAEFTVFAVSEEGERATRGGANIRSYLRDESGKDICKVQVLDNRNGTYSCKYSSPDAGVFHLHVQVGQNPIKDSPFSPKVEPGEPDPSKCVASGPGIESAVAGQPVEFYVQTKDLNGKDLPKGGAHIEAVLEDPSGKIPVEITDNGDGTYTGRYTPHTAAAVKLSVIVKTKSFGEGPVQHSPFSVKVSPGAPSAANTVASGPGTKGATAGVAAPIEVQTKDALGNPLKTGGAPITGTVTHEESGSQFPIDVLDNNDGTYSLNYTPEQMGDYTINVLLGDEPIKDMPLSVSVAPGAADPLQFGWDGLELDANGRRVVVAGHTDNFTITAKDAFGNQLQEGGLDVQGHVKGPEKVPVLVADRADGIYELSYTPTKCGDYTLKVDVANQAIGGAKNPFPFVVIPAAPSADNTVAYGPGVEGAEVGKDNTFTVEVRDPFDNKLTMGGVEIGGQLESDEGDVVPIEVVDNGDGTYTCSYPGVQKAGNYRLTPTLDGNPIKDAPFNIEVHPGGVSVDNTEVVFPDANLAGGSGPIVKLKDHHGNQRKKGGDHIVAELVPKSRLKDIKAKDNGDGTYDVHYPAHLRGKYDVVVKVNDKEVPGGPWEADVDENPLSEEHQEQVSKIVSPAAAPLMTKLLLNATPEERDTILKELSALANL